MNRRAAVAGTGELKSWTRFMCATWRCGAWLNRRWGLAGVGVVTRFSIGNHEALPNGCRREAECLRS